MPEVGPPDGGVEDRFADLILDNFGSDNEAEGAEEVDGEEVDMEALREACFAAEADEARGRRRCGRRRRPDLLTKLVTSSKIRLVQSRVSQRFHLILR